MFTEDNYIMWLTRVEGIGNKKMKKILDYFGSAENVWNSNGELLKNVKGLNKNNIGNIINSKSEKLMNERIEELDKKNIKYITINNNKYPELLKNINDFPFGIYVIGEIPDKNYKRVGIVGARNCTEYGLINAYKLGKEISQRKVVIVSGMALGIDASAHKGALDANGMTIAVLGCGVDICYPASNRDIYNEIIKTGCIISEYPPGSEPSSSHFPVRNRIISGLSDAILVIEAAKRSGTITTVNQALEQGRDVFAVPGNITSRLSEGTNNLIKQGAYPLTEAEDIFSVLNICEKSTDMEINKNAYDCLAPKEKLVYDCISLEPITVDELIIKLKGNIESVQYMLTMLEIKGLIQRLPAQKYIRSL